MNSNDYRKRVLAAVLRRGGPDTSDAFELYDVALDAASDADVRAQVDAVWAFWQRSRDHPKYGTLCGLLVEGHDERSWELIDSGRRMLLARRVVTAREQRDSARHELLDAAIRRLVERHRGVPRDKVDGLVELGALHGLTADEVRSRLRMHRLVDVASAPPAVAAPVTSAVTDSRRRQVRDLLDEFGRLNEAPAPPTLFALLGLDPSADERDIAQRAAAWRERVRELPPLRIRAVADELMVHVRELLEAGPIVRTSYLEAVAADVADVLRPRVRAAVLVEDRLVADDHDHLLEEAEALGLDPTRGRAVLRALADELGAPIESWTAAAPPSAQPGRPAWERMLREARAALRQGRLVEAQRLAGEATRAAGVEGATPVRAVGDEIEDAVAAARLRWRAATTALGARRFAEALEHLEYLVRRAVDLPGPSGTSAPAELKRARAEAAAADAAVAAAGTDPTALSGVLARWPDHPAAVAALAALALEPPSAVTATRGAGTTVIAWRASPTVGVTYRVSRQAPDGSWGVVGRTPGTSLEDGGAPPGPLAAYSVVALLAGRASTAASTGGTATAIDGPAAPTDVAAHRRPDGTVEITWDGPPGAEFRVSRVTPDGRRQVVGRTRLHVLEDGGAPPDLPGYVVTATVDRRTSPDATT